jgi:hypothetical protein
MEYKKLIIEKLFDQYNFEIDLSKRCNILVGPNGVGKTTILKIIFNTMRRDFVELARFKFDKIQILYKKKDEEKTFEFKRSDLFPESDYIFKEFQKSFEEIPEDHLGRDFNSEIWQIFIKLEKNNIFNDYLSNLYFDKKHSLEIKEILKTYKYLIPDSYMSFDNTIKKILDNNIYNMYNHNPHLFFYNSKISKKEIPIEKKEIFYLDLVDKFEVDNSYIEESNVRSLYVDWLNDIKNVGMTPGQISSDLIGVSRNINKLTEGNIINICKDISEKIDDFNIDGNKHKKTSMITTKLISENDNFLKNIIENRKIEINKIISRNYYDKEYIIDFNKRLMAHYKNIVGKKIEYLDQNNFYKDESIIDNIYKYFKPIMCKNSIFDINFKDKSFMGDQFNSIDLEFYKFYKEEIDNLKNKNNQTDKMKKFINLIKKYFVDKDVEVYPYGIEFRKKHIESYTIKNFEVHSNKSNYIDIAALSSGEKKIIMLIAISVFIDDTKIILDEPELSISLENQERIILDILSNDSLEKLYTATHSPFIISDEELVDHISFLPQKEVD